MKYFLILVVVVGVAFGAWYMYKPATYAPSPSTELMGTDQTGNIVTQPNQTIPTHTEAEVLKAFVSQVKGVVTPKETTVVSPYALQVWTDSLGGGEALLLFTSSGWKLISMGGGAWSVEGLVAFGVPQEIAGQLIANRKWSN